MTDLKEIDRRRRKREKERRKCQFESSRGEAETVDPLREAGWSAAKNLNFLPFACAMGGHPFLFFRRWINAQCIVELPVSQPINSEVVSFRCGGASKNMDRVELINLHISFDPFRSREKRPYPEKELKYGFSCLLRFIHRNNKEKQFAFWDLHWEMRIYMGSCHVLVNLCRI